MTTSFSIGYEWLSSAHGDEITQSTLAALTVNVGRWCATEVEDISAKTVRTSARLSALHLSEWFAANWWRLLWEPETGGNRKTYSWRASHKIGNAGNGYVWPDLSFSTDWHSMQIRSRPTAQLRGEPIRYLNSFECYISIGDFEAGVDEFISATIGRLSSLGNSRTELCMLWNEVIDERRDPEISGIRRLEACMGFDPDDAPDDLIHILQNQMRSYGNEAIHELAADLKVHAVGYVADLEGDATRSGILVDVPQCDDIRNRVVAETAQSDIPWRRAEHAARIARETWGLDTPVSTERLCDLFGILGTRFRDPELDNRQPLFAGFRSHAASHKFQISLRGSRETSRRFALARLVADHITAVDDERLLPGTRANTERQKFQRAFAQELLCPFDALNEYLNEESPRSDDEIDEAAQYFTVSPLTIRSTLVNKGVLERDSLIDFFG